MPTPTQSPTPTPTGAVFFRRSRLFLREAAFSSGGEGCEWGAKQPTVGASGKKLKTRFQVLSHSSSHARAPALTSPPPDFFISFIPQNPPKIHPKSKNPNKSIPIPLYIYNVYPPTPAKKNQKNICPSPKKALTLHSQNRKRRTCSQGKAGQKPTKSQTAKIFSKKALKICTVQIKVVILHHFRLAKKIISRERFF